MLESKSLREAHFFERIESGHQDAGCNPADDNCEPHVRFKGREVDAGGDGKADQDRCQDESSGYVLSHLWDGLQKWNSHP